MPHSIARIEDVLAREMRSQPVGPVDFSAEHGVRPERSPVKAARIWVNGKLDSGSDSARFPLDHTSEIYD